MMIHQLSDQGASVMWMKVNWPGLLVVLLPALIGGAALWRYHKSRNKDLLAAVVGFTAVAAALLGGALWAAGIPQLLLGSYTPTDADQGWKATQSITLTFGALGLVAASVITYHRQRSLEKQVRIGRKQLKQDRSKFEADQARERERNQQDRYSQGAQMLADKSSAVRIAGLNVIAALGGEVEPDNRLRQTCLNLICAYLRVSSPVGDSKDVVDARNRYSEAAQEACTLLDSLFDDVDEESAPNLHILLPYTFIPHLDLSERTLGAVNFTGSKFPDGATFESAVFTRPAFFSNSIFERTLILQNAKFRNVAFFDRVTFSTVLSWGAVYGDTCEAIRLDRIPTGTWAAGEVVFVESSFKGYADYRQSRFQTFAEFSRVRFEEEADFEGAQFTAFSKKEALTQQGVTFVLSEAFAGAHFGPIDTDSLTTDPL